MTFEESEKLFLEQSWRQKGASYKKWMAQVDKCVQEHGEDQIMIECKTGGTEEGQTMLWKRVIKLDGTPLTAWDNESWPCPPFC